MNLDERREYMEWVTQETDRITPIDPVVYSLNAVMDMFISAVGNPKIDLEDFRDKLINLLYRRPISPIENVDDVWKKVDTRWDESAVYVCKRLNTLFKHVDKDGHECFTDIDRFICVDINNPKCFCRINVAERVLDEMIPIKFPYTKDDGLIKIYIEWFKYHKNSPVEDTIGIFYIHKPDETLIEVNRFFKINCDISSIAMYTEITKSEYLSRKLKWSGNTQQNKDAVRSIDLRKRGE